MDEKQTGARPAQAGEPCLCREAIRCMDRMLSFRSEAVRQHLRNSRIEFLKAIRTVIDERIQYLARTEQQQGTKVSVE